MRAAWTIAKREVRAFFVLPVAYVVLTVWLLYFGVVFSLLAEFFSAQPGAGRGGGLMGAFFGGTMLFYLPLLVFAPVLTMRLFAEEKATGTIEPLMTAPIGEWSIVMGKYLAAMAFWCALWAPTLLYFWIVSGLGDDTVDHGAMGAIYIGLLCAGLLYMALGLLMSAVSKSQIGAALLTFMALGALFLIGIQSYTLQDDAARELCEYLGVWSQLGTFAKGIVDTRFIVLDLSIAALAIFVTVKVVQAQRWQ
ncbi:MAG: ABC transporter permease subunit [Myxococcales bacterium]|nr:ABC transporter permease subunit [Myxococcales bacterium]